MLNTDLLYITEDELCKLKELQYFWHNIYENTHNNCTGIQACAVIPHRLDIYELNTFWVIYTEAAHEKKVQEHLAVHVHMFLSMHTHIHVWVGLKVHWSAQVCLDGPVGSQMINGIMDSQAAGQSFNHQH